MMKNKSQKVIALLLIFCLLSGFCTTVVGANDIYPESEHNYQNNFKYTWHYDYGEDAEALFVTFSENTCLEKPTFTSRPSTGGSNITIIIGGNKVTKDGDKLTVTAENYSYSATGKELAGKTLYIPGSSFDICLETDSTVTDYGFSIDRISHIAPDDVAVVTYYCCDKCGMTKKLCYNSGEEIKVAKDYYCSLDDSAFVSWVDENGEEYSEDEVLEFKSVNLKARRIPLLLERNEVISFSNSDPYFDPDYNGGYYLTKEDYMMMHRNIFKVFGIGVLPAIGLSVALTTYPDWYWNGSCYGMSSLTFLQHYGVIDVLEGREEKSISELRNEDDVLSIINYYQWSASGSFLCENFSLDKGSKMYSQQLKEIYETVSDGNIVMFTYYTGETFSTSGHTVLLVGAYTQKDGTKVLVTYDPNRPEDYTSGEFEQRFYIDKDNTTVSRGYYYPANNYVEYGEFNWTADYNHFKSFDINGEGGVWPWYSHYFSQLGKLVKTLFSII